MNLDEVLTKIAPEMVSPIMVMIIGYIIKSKLSNIDQIAGLLVEMKTLKEKLAEFKVEFDKLEKHREEFILLKSEVKTQWIRVDEIKEQIKEMSL